LHQCLKFLQEISNGPTNDAAVLSDCHHSQWHDWQYQFSANVFIQEDDDWICCMAMDGARRDVLAAPGCRPAFLTWFTWQNCARHLSFFYRSTVVWKHPISVRFFINSMSSRELLSAPLEGSLRSSTRSLAFSVWLWT